MKVIPRTWLPAALISAVVHSLLIVAVAQGFGHLPPPEKEKPSIEVELTRVSPPQAIIEQKPASPETRKTDARVTPAERPPAAIAVPDQPVKFIPGPPVTAGLAGNEAVAAPSGGTSPKGITGVAPAIPAQRLAVVYAPAPEYPADARSKRWEGTVRISVLVDENGRVQDAQVSVSSGSSSLDQAALACLRTWRFRPYHQDGRPIAAWATVPVVFRLD